MLTMQLYLMLFFKFLTLHNGIISVKAFPETFYDMNGELVELSFEDSNSMEATTTIANEVYEVNPPIQFQTTIMTLTSPNTETSIHEITASPLLMKLIASHETTATESYINRETTTATTITTTTAATQPIMKSRKSMKNRLLSTEVPKIVSFIQNNDETPIASKKPRLLTQSRQSQFKNDAEMDNSMEDTTTFADLDTENNETNIDIGEDITTIIPPSSSTSKRPPKNIEIFKTRPNELLRFYIEDGHLRGPIAALVDKKSNPLNKAKKLWKAALRPNSLLDIMVVSYDSEGIKSTYNLTNTKAMMTTLDKVREENVTDQESKTYYSIIRTGQLIPFDSAIFLSTDNLPNDDTEHKLQASMFLLKKRIRLYLIIFDDKNLSTNETTSNSAATASTTTTTSSATHASVKETGFLGQLALLTGGDIIYVPNYVFQNENNDGEMGYITLIRRNKFKTIDQDPLRDFHENELRNDTETLNAKNDHETTSVN